MQRGLVGSEMCIRDRAHAVVQVLTAVQSIFKDILPCIDSYDELEKLIHKIIDLTPIEILKKLMLNMMDNARKIYKDILAFLAALKENDFYKFGYNVGEILEFLFLKDPKQGDSRFSSLQLHLSLIHI
eukprot:TRINITY_DN22045_c0_g1_i3.p1 TRINITY_DN22045_c0_g1~~TRINITY_DN22045_c0_g1_i3.p1  ORF type:complete len:128 (-),score=25.31 TRINITY_DN22045_c0_g1_i3:165-548(-)